MQRAECEKMEVWNHELVLSGMKAGQLIRMICVKSKVTLLAIAHRLDWFRFCTDSQRKSKRNLSLYRTCMISYYEGKVSSVTVTTAEIFYCGTSSVIFI